MKRTPSDEQPGNSVVRAPNSTRGNRDRMLDGVSTTDGERLLGRDDELRLLFGHLDGAGARGHAVGLLGEPGVGKSALQTAVVEQAQSLGFTVLTARGR